MPVPTTPSIPAGPRRLKQQRGQALVQSGRSNVRGNLGHALRSPKADLPFPALSQAGAIRHVTNPRNGARRRSNSKGSSASTPTAQNVARGPDSASSWGLVLEAVKQRGKQSSPDRWFAGYEEARSEEGNLKGCDSPCAGSSHAIDQVIHKSPIFKPCSYDFVESLLLQMRNRVVKDGTAIVEEGDEAPTSLFIVVNGEAAIHRSGEYCASVATGQYFGEAMLFGTAGVWNATVYAKSQCMVCELPRECLEEVLKDFREDKARFDGILGNSVQRRSREDRDRVAAASLRRSCFFGSCSDAFLRDLASNMDRRLYFAGERLYAEGNDDIAVYLLEHGSVAISVADRVVRFVEIPRVQTKAAHSEDFGVLRRGSLKDSRLPTRGSPDASASTDSPFGSREGRGRSDVQQPDEYSQMVEAFDGWPAGALIGEESLLAEPRRTNTATARSLCDVRVLYMPALLQTLARHDEDRVSLEDMLQRRRAEAFPAVDTGSSQFFQNVLCSADCVEWLSSHVEERIIRSGDGLQLDGLQKNIHPPMPPARSNASFCVLHRGRLQVNNMRPVQEEFLEAGSVLQGATLWESSAWVAAVETSYISIVHRVVLAEAMELFPCDRDLIMSQISHNSEEAANQRRGSHPGQVSRILSERSIFANAPAEFLEEIVRLGKIRVFMPGERIIEQGMDGNSMFLLSAGTANVVKEFMEDADTQPTRILTNVGTLTHGSVFGELVMLGVQSKRTASIIAATVCCTWEVEHHTILAILDRHPSARSDFLALVEEHVAKLAAPQIINQPLFTSFHQQFRTLLAVNCERTLVFPQQMIFRENTSGDRLYIMNLGRASLEIGGQHVMPVHGGAYFGFGMISLDYSHKERFPGTLVSETMCQVLVITRATYIHAIMKYPEMRDPARALEREERQRHTRQKAAFQRMVRRRRGLRCILEALRGVTAPPEPKGEEDTEAKNTRMLQATFAAWLVQVQKLKDLASQELELQNSNSKRIEEWLARRRKQMEHVKHRAALKHLVAQNLERRGPLTIAKQLAYKEPEKKPLSKVWSEASTYASSPYMSPSPVWRLAAWSKVQQQRPSMRWLPPLPRARAVGRNCARPTLFGRLPTPPRTAPAASSRARQAEDEEDDVFPPSPRSERTESRQSGSGSRRSSTRPQDSSRRGSRASAYSPASVASSSDEDNSPTGIFGRQSSDELILRRRASGSEDVLEFRRVRRKSDSSVFTGSCGDTTSGRYSWRQSLDSVVAKLDEAIFARTRTRTTSTVERCDEASDDENEEVENFLREVGYANDELSLYVGAMGRSSIVVMPSVSEEGEVADQPDTPVA